MATDKVTGSRDHVATSVREEHSDRTAKIVEVEGLYSHLESCFDSIVEEEKGDYVVESSTLSSNGDGTGKITIRLISYDTSHDIGPVRKTFRVDMQEVQYDLEDHPHLETERELILKWLGTDESKRVDGNEYYYSDKGGNLHKITLQSNNKAYKFCVAYMSGIKSFNRYYPVVERISIYKNPPGMTLNNNSFTGGSPNFSKCGTYNDPPISLSGYPNGHWFKSKDSWVHNTDKTWTRTEQWTYTPEPSDGSNSWIYNTL